ncbi:hypothetical protein [Solihabitans fulvus]|nr:hypothetical protein [Solihabitans fulvus]
MGREAALLPLARNASDGVPSAIVVHPCGPLDKLLAHCWLANLPRRRF